MPLSPTPTAQRMAVALLTCAGASLVLGQALMPALPSAADAQVTTVLAHRAAVAGSGAAFLLAAALLLLGVDRLGRPTGLKARRLVAVGLATTAVGSLWPAVGRATFNLILVAITGGAPRAAAVSAAQAIGSSSAMSILLPTLAAFVLGPILLGIGLWRSGVGALWPVALWLVGVIVVNGAAQTSRPLATAGMAVAAAGLVLVGRRVPSAAAGHEVASADSPLVLSDPVSRAVASTS